MSDRLVVLLAAAVATGAWFRPPVTLWVALLAVAVALATRARPPLMALIAGALLAAALGGRAIDGLTPAIVPGAGVRGVATLVGDPEVVLGGVRVDVRIAGHRWRATATDAAERALSGASAGQRYTIEASYRPLDPAAAERLRSRHLAGRLSVEQAHFHDAGGPVSRVANAVRSVLTAGVAHLPPDRQALFTGVVLGDDRRQRPAEVEDFRAGGLSHLLAVSGQNVAFLFALAAPALRRLRPPARTVAAVGLLVVFGTVTRWEPSVIRAAGMASVTLLATETGRPVASVRTLAVAAGGLLLVDPLLVHSIGFVLSTAACGGLAVLGPRLATRLPLAVAATLAAQTAVLPLLLGWFGPVPVASLPANLLAGPVAGPLMMWGIAAGIPAGICGGGLAQMLHLPTHALLVWLSGVARLSAGIPLAWLTPASVTASLVALGVTAVVARRRPHLRPVAAGTAAIVAFACVLLPGVHPRPLDELRLDTYGDDRVWRRGRVVVVVTDAAAAPGQLLNVLRQQGITAIDVLVTTSGSKRAAVVLAPTFERIAVATVLAPPNHQIAGAIAVETPAAVVIDPFRVDVRPDGKRLDVRIGSP